MSMTESDKVRLADELGNAAKLFVEACAGKSDAAWNVGRDRLQQYMRLLATPSLAQFSLGNQLLIAIQADELAVYPSKLGTIQQWVTLGREPMQGARSMKLMLKPEGAKVHPHVHDEPINRYGGSIQGLLGRLGYVSHDDRKYVLIDKAANIGLPGTLADEIVVLRQEGEAYQLEFKRVAGNKTITESLLLCTPVEITRAAINGVGVPSEDVRAALDTLVGRDKHRESRAEQMAVAHVYDVAQTTVIRPELDAAFPEHLVPTNKEAVLALVVAGYTKQPTLSGAVRDFIDREYKPQHSSLTEADHQKVKDLLLEIAQVHVRAKGWRDAKVAPLGGDTKVATQMLVTLRDSWLRMSHTLSLLVAQAKASPELARATQVVALPERSPPERSTGSDVQVVAAPKFSPFSSTKAAVASQNALPAPATTKPRFSPFGVSSAPPADAEPAKSA